MNVLLIQMQHTNFLHNLEVADLIHFWEKLFLKFKKSKLHINEEIYKKKTGTKFKK